MCGIFLRSESMDTLLEHVTLTPGSIFFRGEILDALLELLNNRPQIGGFALRHVLLRCNRVETLLEDSKLTVHGVFLGHQRVDTMPEPLKLALHILPPLCPWISSDSCDKPARIIPEKQLRSLQHLLPLTFP